MLETILNRASIYILKKNTIMFSNSKETALLTQINQKDMELG